MATAQEGENMLPLDVQGELLISFQEERLQQRLIDAAAPRKQTLRARFFRRSGELMVHAGLGLQRAAGGTLTVAAGRLGETAR
jgi:hypothetical protein